MAGKVGSYISIVYSLWALGILKIIIINIKTNIKYQQLVLVIIIKNMFIIFVLL